MKSVRQVDINKISKSQFHRQYVGCVVLTHDNRILLQKRGDDWKRYPGYIAEFGGQIEAGETPMQALIRELNEELGAVVNEDEVIRFGAITEATTHHTELVYVYFWHDKKATITGCYEGSPAYFHNAESALKNTKMMEGVRWLLTICRHKQLIL